MRIGRIVSRLIYLICFAVAHSRMVVSLEIGSEYFLSFNGTAFTLPKAIRYLA